MQASLVRWVAALGVALLVGVVVWQLTRATYKRDLEKMCNAEKSSGVTLTKDNQAVVKWIKEHLDTPEGGTFFTGLLGKPQADRAGALESEAKRVGIATCPLVPSYNALAADSLYRTDLQLMCSMTGMPPLERLADDEKLAKVQKWGETQAKSPRTKDAIAKVAAAEAKKRGDTLRAIANDSNVYGCELAHILEEPPQQAPPQAGFVRLVSAETTGGLTEKDVFAAMTTDLDSYKKCYDAALLADSALTGRVTIKLLVDQDGKVVSARPVFGPPSYRQVAECLGHEMKNQKFPATKAKVTTVTLVLDLVPMNKATAQAPGADAGTP
jgi:hypothetical protein